jgi:4-diphosphocytidyl-2-C-methyl-D-erythritol kinase
VLVLPSRARLSSAAVYAQADRLGAPRSAAELGAIAARIDVRAPAAVNDLAAAASLLEPTIDRALAVALESGADVAMVSGSGPTVVGLFASVEAAGAAAEGLRRRGVDAIASRPLLRHN